MTLTARTSPPTTPRAPTRVWLRTLLASGATAALLLLVSNASAGFSRDRRPITIASLMYVVAPYVVGLMATLAGATRPFGLTVLASAGAVCVAWAVYYGVAVVAYFGPQGVIYWVGLGPFGIANGAMTLAAVRSGLAAEPSRGRAAGMVIAVIAMALHMVVSQRQLDTMERRLDADRAAAIAESMAADDNRRHIVDRLRRCLAPIRLAGVEGPGVRTLADLGPEGRRCAAEDELVPPDGSYAVHVFAPASAPRSRTFTVCVTRTSAGGHDAEIVDELGRRDRHGQGTTPAAACADAYADDLLRQTRLCLQAWAADHDGGYPEQLGALRAEPACLTPTAFAAATSRLTYVPGARRAEGTAAHFAALDVQTADGGRAMTRRLDDGGEIHVTTAPRLPTVHDARDGIESDSPRPAPHERLDVAALERACDRGHQGSCMLLARALERRSLAWRAVTVRYGSDGPAAPVALMTGEPVSDADALRALMLSRAACQAWVGPACADAARLLRAQAPGMTNPESRRLDIRGCSRGVQASCDALASSGGPVAHGNVDPWDPRSLADQCADDVGAACTAEAGRVGRTDPAAAVRLYERGCEYGDPEACLRAAGVMADAQRAAALRALACAVLPKDSRCRPGQP
jgi:hypothetical protein